MNLRFNREFDPRHGEAVQVAPAIRRVTAPNPGPFTFHGTNTFLIGDDDELAILDPGPADGTHVEALLRAIGPAKVSAILVSHTHLDHSPAAGLIKQATGAPVLAAGAHRLARPLHAEEAIRLDAGADLDFIPDVILADGAVAEAGSLRLQTIASPGHTANHLAFALLDHNIIFSGDHVMGWSTTLVAPPDGSMADYIRSLDRLLARPEQVYLPAHGGPIAGAHSYLRGLKAHRRMRERAILERLQSGDRSIADMVPRIYSDIDKRLFGAAALATLAHIEDLVERGLVATDSAPSLMSLYSPVAAPSGTAAIGVPDSSTG